MTKSICIIGFGISGVSCTRWAKEIGLKISVLESSDNLGGCWYHKNYDNVKLQTTKYSYAFSDMAMDEDIPLHPTYQNIIDYITKYCNHHQLLQYVSFSHRVLSVNYDNQWEIRYHDLTTNKINSIYTDYLAICSGLYYKPIIPEFAEPYIINKNEFKPLLKTNQMNIYHSYQFSSEQKTNLSIFKNKNIVIIGNGPTGCDLATMACDNCSKSVHLLYRSDRWIFTRKSGIINNFFYTNRFLFALSKYVSYIIIIIWLKLMFFFHYYSSGYVKRINQPNTIINRNNIALSESIFEYINQKKIIYEKCKDIQIVDNKCIYSHKGKQKILYPDVIILATGYSTKIPFLNIDKIPYLYKRIIHPALPNCAFIGFSASFNWVQISDLQSRWFMKMIIGQIKLPRKKEMLENIKKDVYKWKSLPYEYNDLTFNAYEYSDELAMDMNINIKKRWLTVSRYDDWSGF